MHSLLRLSLPLALQTNLHGFSGLRQGVGYHPTKHALVLISQLEYPSLISQSSWRWRRGGYGGGRSLRQIIAQTVLKTSLYEGPWRANLDGGCHPISYLGLRKNQSLILLNIIMLKKE